MGSSKHRRGWNDRNLFAAKTTHSKVSPIEFNFETEDENGEIVRTRTVSRWSYAIPLEIIYQTPLSVWNPYNIEFSQDRTPNIENDGCFDSWTISNAYFTPSSFFEGLSGTSSADTAADNVCAVGSDGVSYPVYPSGHWITFPEIGNGVGLVRQRYPIFPIHSAGSAAFKEVKALQSVILPDDYDDIDNGLDFFGDDRDKIYGFELNLQGGGHQHVVYIPGWRVRYYWYDRTDTDVELSSSDDVIEAESDTRNGHAHTVRIWRERDIGTDEWIYHVKQCRPGSISDNYDESYWSNDQCNDYHNSLSRV